MYTEYILCDNIYYFLFLKCSCKKLLIKKLLNIHVVIIIIILKLETR